MAAWLVEFDSQIYKTLIEWHHNSFAVQFMIIFFLVRLNFFDNSILAIFLSCNIVDLIGTTNLWGLQVNFWRFSNACF